MWHIIVQILINAIAIYVAANIVPGISFTGDNTTLLLAGFIMGLINFFIKPVLKLISLPLIFITLGLFTIVINMILLEILAYLVPEFKIGGLAAAFWGVVVISAVNIFFSAFTKK